MSTARKTTERHATHEEWRELRARITRPENVRAFDANELAVYADREGKMRILPPLGHVARAVTSVERDDARSSAERPGDVVDAVHELGGPVGSADAVAAALVCVAPLASRGAAATRAPATSSSADEVLAEVERMGRDASQVDDVALREVVRLSKGEV